MYLDAKTRTKVEETGGANFFFVIKVRKELNNAKWKNFKYYEQGTSTGKSENSDKQIYYIKYSNYAKFISFFKCQYFS